MSDKEKKESGQGEKGSKKLPPQNGRKILFFRLGKIKNSSKRGLTSFQNVMIVWNFPMKSQAKDRFSHTYYPDQWEYR